MRKLFLNLANLAPTILIFDDLHWIDPASRDFLKYLIQTTPDSPLLLIIISRKLERKTVLRTLVETAKKHPVRTVDIQLKALSDSEGQRLINQIINDPEGEVEAIKKRIAERAEGNPLFVEEIIRMLIDQEKLKKSNETWQVSPGAMELLQKVPGSLKGLVLARYDELPANLRRTLIKRLCWAHRFPWNCLPG